VSIADVLYFFFCCVEVLETSTKPLALHHYITVLSNNMRMQLCQGPENSLTAEDAFTSHFIWMHFFEVLYLLFFVEKVGHAQVAVEGLDFLVHHFHMQHHPFFAIKFMSTINATDKTKILLQFYHRV
jgi:hypothetical protein